MDQIHSYSGGGFNSNVTTSPSNSVFTLASGLPTQVYKIFNNSTFVLDDYRRVVGNKNYELKDHLGNVRVVISDAKMIEDVNTDDLVDNNDKVYPEIRNFTDYYAGGMLMPGRQYNSGDYRYGFNGMEKDDEIKGAANNLDFGERIYDSRILRWFSLDPLAVKYTGMSPYIAFKNNPVFNIDADGRDAIGYIGEDGKLYIKATYYAVSEGKSTFNSVEMQNIESKLNNFWGQAIGQKVKLSDGKEYEVGGVTFNVVAGGDLQSTMVKANSSPDGNVLIKVSTEHIKAVSGPGNAAYTSNEASVFANDEKPTRNTTYIDETAFTQMSPSEETKTKSDNSLRDEAGHVLGTDHPEPPGQKKGENLSAFNKRMGNYGSVERGKLKADGRLASPNQKDLQNIVNSPEFQIKK